MFLTAPQLDVQVDIVDSTGQEDIVISKDMQKLDVDGEREVASPDSRNFLNGNLLHLYIHLLTHLQALGFMRGANTGCRVKVTAVVNRVEVCAPP